MRAAVTSSDRDSLVEIEINPSRANRVRLNRVPVPRPREVLGTLRCVLFAPEDLTLVKGDPDQRRRFLDDLLVATAPRYAGVRADYERAVRQRTALLKSARARGGGRPSALAAWDEQLVKAGAELAAGRLDLVTAIRPLAAKAYAAVSGDEGTAEMAYRQPYAGPGRAAGRGGRAARGDAGRAGDRQDGRAGTGGVPGRPAPGRARAADRRAARARVRQPRRVVVAGARAAAGRVRPAALRAARTRC